MEATPKNESYPLLSASYKQIVKTANTLLINNEGKGRPFTVAVDQLLAVLLHNASEYHQICQGNVGKQGRFIPLDRFLKKTEDKVYRTMDNSCEILCTLAMCDLTIPASRDLFYQILEELEKSKSAKTFYHVTTQFAKRSLYRREGQVSRDAEPCLVDIEFYNPQRRGFQKVGASVSKIEFANLVTYIAYRYFLRFAWMTLEGVPKQWKMRSTYGIYDWIEYTSKTKNRAVSLDDYCEQILKPAEKQRLQQLKEKKAASSSSATATTTEVTSTTSTEEPKPKPKAKSFYKEGLRVVGSETTPALKKGKAKVESSTSTSQESSSPTAAESSETTKKPTKPTWQGKSWTQVVQQPVKQSAPVIVPQKNLQVTVLPKGRKVMLKEVAIKPVVTPDPVIMSILKNSQNIGSWADHMDEEDEKK